MSKSVRTVTVDLKIVYNIEADESDEYLRGMFDVITQQGVGTVEERLESLANEHCLSCSHQETTTEIIVKEGVAP